MPRTPSNGNSFCAAIRLANGLAKRRVVEGCGAAAGAAGAGATGAEAAAGGASATGAGVGAEAAAAGASSGTVTEDTSSPSSASTAITAPTATFCAPAAMTILAITPSSTDSTSIVALSVSISAITSPERTSSPSATSHLANVPSVIVGDKAGILMVIDISGLPRDSRLYAQLLECHQSVAERVFQDFRHKASAHLCQSRAQQAHLDNQSNVP